MDNADKKWVDEQNFKEINEEVEEGNFTGEIFLSTDGKNTVHVVAHDKSGRRDALTWAKEVYEGLRDAYGTKQSQNVKEYSKNGDQGFGTCPKCKSPLIEIKKEGQVMGLKCSTNKWNKVKKVAEGCDFVEWNP